MTTFFHPPQPNEVFLVNTSQSSKLVNLTRLRASLHGIFNGTFEEVFGELVQNSQRTGATRFEVTFDGGSLFIADNRPGLATIEAFHTLLKLTESDYSGFLMANQAPLGLGFYAALAHPKFTTVIIRSQELSLTIDTARWWSDQDYFANWINLMETLPNPIEGLQVEIHTQGMNQADWDLISSFFNGQSIILGGYADLLEIYFKGEKVDNFFTIDILFNAYHSSFSSLKLLDTEYQGNQLTIYLTPEHAYPRGVVDWYGQIFKVDCTIGFHLKVRKGLPLNMMAPLRKGAIRDSKWVKLIQFAQDAAFDHILAKDVPSVNQLKELFRINPTRALECPYLLVRNLVLGEQINELLDISEGRLQVVRYDDPDITAFVDKSIYLCVGNEVTELPNGLESLVQAAGLVNPCVAIVFNPLRIEHKAMYWHIGESIGSRLFYEPGGYSFDGGEPIPFPMGAELFAINYGGLELPDERGTVYFSSSNPLAFLDKFGWVAFAPDGEDPEDFNDRYHLSLRNLKIEIEGDAVPQQFSYTVLKHMFSDVAGSVEIDTVQFLRDKGEVSKILVSTLDGRTKTLTLIA